MGDDLTGKTIATIDSPRGMQFTNVQGTFDDRTFIALTAAQSWSPVMPGPVPPFSQTLYLVRIAEGTQHPSQLTKLPIKPPDNSWVLSYALSPDGRELAVESTPVSGRPDPLTTLGIYAVSSGAELRAWSTRTPIASDFGRITLSWLADGRQLAFSDVPPLADQATVQYQLRTIDVTSAGNDLLADSRVVLTVKSPSSSPADCRTMQLTPDGGTAICGTQYGYSNGSPGGFNSGAGKFGPRAGCSNGGLEFTAYSIRTGKPVRDLYQYRGACATGLSYVLWTDASARYIIGATQTDMANDGGGGTSQLGVITDGRIRLLKMPKILSPTDYGTVAF